MADPFQPDDPVSRFLAVPFEQLGTPAVAAATPNPAASDLDRARAVMAEEDTDKQRKADLLKWAAENATLSPAESETVLKLSAGTGVAPDAILQQGIEPFRKANAYKVDWYKVANEHPALSELIGDPAHGPYAITDTQKLEGVSRWLGKWELVQETPPEVSLLGYSDQTVPEWKLRPVKGKEGLIFQSLARSVDELARDLRRGAVEWDVDALSLFGPKSIEKVVKDISEGKGVGEALRTQLHANRQDQLDKIKLLGEAVQGYEDITGDLRGYGPAAKLVTNVVVNHVVPALPFVGTLALTGGAAGLASRSLGLSAVGATRMLLASNFAVNTLIATGGLRDRLDAYKDPETGATFTETEKRLTALLGGALTGYVWAPGVTDIVKRELPGLVPGAVQQAASEVLRSTTHLQILRDTLASFGAHVAEGGLTMAAGTMMEESAFQLARSASMGRPAEPAAVARAGAEAFKESLYVMPLISSNSALRTYAARLGRFRRTNDTVRVIDRLLDPNEQSKLAKEAPDLYDRFVRRVVSQADGAPKNAYVSREAWDQMAERLKVDPRELHGTLVADGGKSYDLATRSQDKDLSVPIEKVRHLASSEQLAEFARNEMRLYEGDLSASDLAKYETEIMSRMADTLEAMSPAGRDEAQKYVRDMVAKTLEPLYSQTPEERAATYKDTGTLAGGPDPAFKEKAINLGSRWFFETMLRTYADAPPETRGKSLLEFAQDYFATTQPGGLLEFAGVTPGRELHGYSASGVKGDDIVRGFVDAPTHYGSERFRDVGLTLHKIADFRTVMHEWFHLQTYLEQRFVEKVKAQGLSADTLEAHYNEMLAIMESSQDLRGYWERRQTVGGKPQVPEGTADLGKGRLWVATEEKGAHLFEEYLMRLADGTLPAAKASELAKEVGQLVLTARGGPGTDLAQRRLAERGFASALKDTTLTDRAVAFFDSMLQAEAASDFSLAARGAMPNEKILAGLPEHVRAKYLDTFERAKDAARFEAISRILEANRLKSKDFVRETRQMLVDEQRRVLDNDQGYKVLGALEGNAETGAFTDAFGDFASKLRLDRGVVASIIGEQGAAALQALHPKIFGRGEGLSIIPADTMDTYANAAGYENSKQMLAELFQRPPKEQAVQQFADAALRDVIGDAPDAAALGRAALMAQGAHKALMEKSIIELRWLASQLNPELQKRAAVLDASTLGELARRSIMQRNWAGFKADSFLSGERRWSERAFKALEDGNLDQAYAYKEAQIFNQIYYNEAQRTERTLKEVRNRVKAWSASDAIRGDFGKASIPLRDLFDHVAAGMGVGLQRVDPANASAAVQAFVEDMKRAGESDRIAFEPQALSDALQRLASDQPSVFDVSALTGIAQNLRKISDTINEGRASAENGALKTTREAMRAELKRIGGGAASGGVSLSGGPGGPGAPRKPYTLGFKDRPPTLREWRYVGDSLLTSPDLLIEDFGKTAHDNIYKPFMKQLLYENNLRATVFRAFEDLATGKREWRKIANEVIPTLDEELPLNPVIVGPRAGPRDHSYLWMVALNYGNPEGRMRLLDGYGWTDEQVRTALEKHLTPKEWDLLEKVWTFMDKELWPLVKDTHERNTGLTPEKVQAAPWTLGNGRTISGGYFPLRYDPLSHRSIDAQVEQATRGDEYLPPLATNHGFTYERQERYVDTLHLDWMVLPSHISAVIHDASFRDYLRDMRRLLRDPELVNDMLTYHGKPKVDAVLAWLRSVALNGSEAMPPHLATAMRYLAGPRRNFMKSVLGASIPVVSGDFLNPMVAAVAGQITFRDLAAGVMRGFDKGAWDFAESRSDYLRQRHEHSLERYRDQFDVASTSATRWREVTDHIAYFFMDTVDKLVSTQIWHAKYREIMRTSGDETAAIDAADVAVQRVLPAQSLLERPAILRDKNVLGAMVMFYSWFNKTYTMGREMTRSPWASWLDADTGMKKAGAGLKMAAAAGRLMAMFMASAVLGDYVAGHGRKPDETEGEWLARRTVLAPLTALPWAPQIFDVERGGGKLGIPLLAFYENLRNDVGTTVSENKTPDAKMIAAMHAFLMYSGLPANQIKRGVTYTSNAAQGLEPTTPLDVFSGLAYGSNPGKQADNPFSDLRQAVK